MSTKRCATCRIPVNHTNWARLASGFLLCLACFLKFREGTR